MKSQICLLMLLGSFSHAAVAQRLSKVRAVVNASTVTVVYDLEGAVLGQLFEVNLYSSHNNFSTPLRMVSGDVGKEVQAGSQREIQWQTGELPDFDGKLSFDVRAELTFSPLLVKSPQGNSRYRRGKAYTLAWAGGMPAERIRLELYRDSVKMADVAVLANEGKYQWTVPAKSRPGSGYQVKVASESAPDNYTFSPNFKIRRRTPLLLKVLPAAVAVAVGYLVRPRDKPTPLPRREWLPEPDVM